MTHGSWTVTTRPDRYGDWPTHPEQVPIYFRPNSMIPYEQPPPLAKLGGFDIEWTWRWRTCVGDWVSASNQPAQPVCTQPGVCLIHDPPDTVIPW